MADYLQHGRRHSPGGSDPIPGFPSVALATIEIDTPATVASGGAGHDINFASFRTTDSTVFGTNILGAYGGIRNAVGDNSLILLKAGLYLALARGNWAAGSVNVAVIADVVTTDAHMTDGSGWETTEMLAAVTLAGQELHGFSTQAIWLEAGDQGCFRFEATNADSVSHDLSSGVLNCFYWPCSDSLTTVY